MQLIQKINSATDRPHYREKIRKQPIVETCSAESSGIARISMRETESDLFDRVKIKYSGNVYNFRLSTTSISRIQLQARNMFSFFSYNQIFFIIEKKLRQYSAVPRTVNQTCHEAPLNYASVTTEQHNQIRTITFRSSY